MTMNDKRLQSIINFDKMISQKQSNTKAQAETGKSAGYAKS